MTDNDVAVNRIGLSPSFKKSADYTGHPAQERAGRGLNPHYRQYKRND